MHFKASYILKGVLVYTPMIFLCFLVSFLSCFTSAFFVVGVFVYFGGCFSDWMDQTDWGGGLQLLVYGYFLRCFRFSFSESRAVGWCSPFSTSHTIVS